MTKVQFTLPDALAQRAHNEGLLSDAAIQGLLEEAMRRRAGRRLLDVANEIHAAAIEPMSEEEVDAEVKATRDARRSGKPSADSQ